MWLPPPSDARPRDDGCTCKAETAIGNDQSALLLLLLLRMLQKQVQHCGKIPSHPANASLLGTPWGMVAGCVARSLLLFLFCFYICCWFSWKMQRQLIIIVAEDPLGHGYWPL